MNIWLGKTIKDTITGFVGVVTGHVEYLTRWIDDDRLSVVSEVASVSLPGQGRGADKAAPKR